MERIMCEKIGSGGGRRGGWRAEGGAREGKQRAETATSCIFSIPLRTVLELCHHDL